VAAAKDFLLHGFESALHPADLLIRGQAVLDEVQFAAGFEDPPQFAEGASTSGIVHSVQVDSAAS